jgi:uncharacterized protein (UPF0276 family)
VAAAAAVAGAAEEAISLASVSGRDFLGVGLGYRSAFRADLFAHRDAVDFLEIVADHFFEARREKLDELDLLAAHFPLIPHGLDLSLGSAEGLDEAYLDEFAELIERLDPPWWSEHIAFTRAGGIAIGHLACLPYTIEAIDVLARNVERVRRVIATPLILENVTAAFVIPGGQMDEPEFVTRALAATGCGWLCDVTNIHTNAVNQGRDIEAELARWPWARAVQAHVAGGRIGRDGDLIDSHDRPAPPEAWSLLAAAAKRGALRGAILERDEDLPPFGELLDELDLARAAMGLG